MRKIIDWAITILGGILVFFGVMATFAMFNSPKAHADYFQYPCNYPFVGQGGDVNVIVDAGGQYCDGPTEINWSHYHCEGGGATANVGALGFVSAGGLNLGGFGGSGIGGRYQDCQYRCPDGSIAPFPNPPAAWIKHLVLDPSKNDCDQHMGIRGPSSTPVSNELPGNIAPGEGAPPGVAVPAFPGGLPEGQNNPPALPGPPAPPVVGAGPEQVPMPSGHPVTPNGEDDGGSPLTPGSPMQLP
jgi:hypothetical protein